MECEANGQRRSSGGRDVAAVFVPDDIGRKGHRKMKQNLHISKSFCTFAADLERRRKFYESTVDGVGG